MSGFSDTVQLVNPAPELDFVIASASADVDQTTGVTTIAVVPQASFAQNTTATIPDIGQAAVQFSMVSAVAPATGLTAHAGGTQAAALQLASGFNLVTTVATTGDSVALPLAVAGYNVVVVNAGANTLDVYTNASGTDTINNSADTVAYTIAAGAGVVFYCTKSAPAGQFFAV